MSSPSVLRAAVRHRLVPGDDVRSGRVRVRSVSRSNVVHVVEHDGTPVVYVKQAGATARRVGDDPAGVEALVLASLAALELAPAPVLQGGPGPVWMTAVPGGQLADVSDEAALHAAAVALGQVLARLHRHQCEPLLPDAAIPWPLRDSLPNTMRGAYGRPETRAVVDAVLGPDLRGILANLRASWRATHVIHGDVSASNVLVESNGDGTAQVRLVDFELGGMGSPELDLACAAGLLTDLSQHADLGAVLVRAYAKSRGPAELSPPWHCLRAVLTAWQVALTGGPTAYTVVERLLDRARSTAVGSAG